MKHFSPRGKKRFGRMAELINYFPAGPAEAHFQRPARIKAGWPGSAWLGRPGWLRPVSKGKQALSRPGPAGAFFFAPMVSFAPIVSFAPGQKTLHLRSANTPTVFELFFFA